MRWWMPRCSDLIGESSSRILDRALNKRKRAVPGRLVVQHPIAAVGPGAECCRKLTKAARSALCLAETVHLPQPPRTRLSKLPG